MSFYISNELKSFLKKCFSKVLQHFIKIKYKVIKINLFLKNAGLNKYP